MITKENNSTDENSTHTNSNINPNLKEEKNKDAKDNIEYYKSYNQLIEALYYQDIQNKEKQIQIRDQALSTLHILSTSPNILYSLNIKATITLIKYYTFIDINIKQASLYSKLFLDKHDKKSSIHKRFIINTISLVLCILNENLRNKILETLFYIGFKTIYYLISKFYYHGYHYLNITPNNDLSFEYLQLGTENECRDCLCFLGVRYLKGKGVDKEPEIAVEFLKSAADKDSSKACLYMADCYRSGVGVPLDFVKSIEYDKKGARLGLAECKVSLANSLKLGIGGKIDIQYALQLFEEVIHAKEDINPNVYFHTAEIYLLNKDHLNIRKGFKYLYKAADMGNMHSENLIALLFYQGKIVAKDYEKVVDYSLRINRKDKINTIGISSINNMVRNMCINGKV